MTTGAATQPAIPAESISETASWGRAVGDTFFVFLVAAAVSILLHVPAFYRERKEGDEIVYLELARLMKWDLSHYSTQDSPRIQNWPYSIYRQPLFHHGPLYPLILKFGISVGAPAETGLVFALLCMIALLAGIAAMPRILPCDRIALAAGLLFCAVEPLQMFTTTRLLHDGLSGILLAGGLLAYVGALDRRSAALAVGAGLLLSASLNMRFNVLVALPLVPLLQIFSLYRAHRTRLTAEGTPDSPAVWTVPANWTVFAIVFGLVMTLGMQHFYRLLAEYGTLSPSAIIVPVPNIREVLPITEFWDSQTRLQSIFHLAVMMPVLLLVLSPPVLRQVFEGCRKGDWSAALWGSLAYLFACWAWFSHTQLRYAAIWTPLFCLLLPWMLGATARRFPRTVVSLLVLTFVSSISADYWSTVFDQSTGEIVPAFYFYLPFLSPLYRTGWGS